ncbi:hypothetical protein [Lachnoclostridium sp. Marseille-P6806]|uniref:hypothetical protein n=1 Tax=Lachnoclostridium sp. Marseille-P6806 TaxID=2364793 RepID=UPI00102F4B16|nr:hypothetical protein [Lachnoclostridium sp. Marseille-P6806]
MNTFAYVAAIAIAASYIFIFATYIIYIRGYNKKYKEVYRKGYLDGVNKCIEITKGSISKNKSVKTPENHAS